MGLYENTFILDGYISRAQKTGQASKTRELGSDEFDLFMDLKKTDREAAILITELITIACALDIMRHNDLFFISANLKRVIASLRKQRRKGYVVRLTYLSAVPNAEELRQVHNFVSAFNERIRYVREFVIPENLNLTPVKEYLEIVGSQDIRSDLYRYFGDRKTMFEATSGEKPELVEQYVSDILSMVEKNGRLGESEERLKAYACYSKEKQAKEQDEKARQREMKKLEEAKEAMLRFQRLFNDGADHMSGCARIKMGPNVITDIINKYGRGCWFILACYVFQGDPVYRYVTRDGQLYNIFGERDVFMNEDEARKVMERVQKEHPERVFDVVKFYNMETESA